MTGNCAAFSQSAAFRSESSLALVVRTLATGTLTLRRLAAVCFGSSVSVPEAPVKSPNQVVKPMWLTAKAMRVWLGSTVYAPLFTAAGLVVVTWPCAASGRAARQAIRLGRAARMRRNSNVSASG